MHRATCSLGLRARAAEDLELAEGSKDTLTSVKVLDVAPVGEGGGVSDPPEEDVNQAALLTVGLRLVSMHGDEQIHLVDVQAYLNAHDVARALNGEVDLGGITAGTVEDGTVAEGLEGMERYGTSRCGVEEVRPAITPRDFHAGVHVVNLQVGVVEGEALARVEDCTIEIRGDVYSGPRGGELVLPLHGLYDHLKRAPFPERRRGERDVPDLTYCHNLDLALDIVGGEGGSSLIDGRVTDVLLHLLLLVVSLENKDILKKFQTRVFCTFVLCILDPFHQSLTISTTVSPLCFHVSS